MDTGGGSQLCPPVGEQGPVNFERERNFWPQIRSQKNAENEKAEREFRQSYIEARSDEKNAIAQRNQLIDRKSVLTKEIEQVEARLEYSDLDCKEKTDRVERIEQNYRTSRIHREGHLEDIWTTMRRFFRKKRGEDPDAPDDFGPESEGIVLPKVFPELSSPFDGPIPRIEHINGVSPVVDRSDEADDEGPMEVVEHHNTEVAETLVNVTDAHGNAIGVVEQVEPRNRRVEGIQELEIRRPVEIRRGHTILPTAEAQPRYEPIGQTQPGRVVQQIHVPARPLPSSTIALREIVPERQDERRPIEPQSERIAEHQAEWNTVRQPERYPEPQPERLPDRSNESFQDAIVTTTPERPIELPPVQIAECGRDTSHEPIYGSPHESPGRPTTARRSDHAPERTIEPVESPLPTPNYPPSRPLKTPRSVLPSGASRYPLHNNVHPSTQDNGYNHGFDPVHTPRGPERLYTTEEHRINSGFTPVNVRIQPPSSEQGRQTPPSSQIELSSQQPEMPLGLPVEEIHCENMILENDGVVYTSPEWMVGVPLIKIDKKHEYWERSWCDPEAYIQEKIAKEIAKPEQPFRDPQTQILIPEERRNLKQYQEVLHLLKECPISPYQLLRKEYIIDGGNISTYQPLYGLTKTFSELESFELDISPVDWIRRRLRELIKEQPQKFKLSKALAALRGDLELKKLRSNHRDNRSGLYRGMEARLSSGRPSNIPEPLQKRKSMPSVSTTHREDSVSNHFPLSNQTPSGYTVPASAPNLAPVAGPGSQQDFSAHRIKKPRYT
ncbi:hypothetical protein FOWG_17018 [Fusarium oxysporum f. sp. lycopersici MN25]|nr:hypothetical protein FOWG_17018 [Fusarium oxysporum f. sp. lycopersici MN25]